MTRISIRLRIFCHTENNGNQKNFRQPTSHRTCTSHEPKRVWDFGAAGPAGAARRGPDTRRIPEPRTQQSCPLAKERPEIERALWAPPKTLDTRNYPHTTPYSWAQPPQPLSAACAGTARRGRADPDAPGRRGGGTDIGLCAHAMHAKVKTQNTPVVATDTRHHSHKREKTVTHDVPVWTAERGKKEPRLSREAEDDYTTYRR